MFPVCEGKRFSKKNTGSLINSCHTTEAVIDEYDESDDGILTVILVLTYL